MSYLLRTNGIAAVVPALPEKGEGRAPVSVAEKGKRLGCAPPDFWDRAAGESGPGPQKREPGSGELRLLGVARIVGGIDVFELNRALPVEDDGGFLGAGVGEVIHVGRHEGEAAGGESLVAFSRFIEFVAHAEGESAGYDDDVFVGGMGVRWDRIVRRELETHGVEACAHGVASEYGDLRPRREHRGSGSPFRVAGRRDDMFAALSIENAARCARKNRGYRNGLHEGFQGCLLRVLPSAKQYTARRTGWSSP